MFCLELTVVFTPGVNNDWRRVIWELNHPPGHYLGPQLPPTRVDIHGYAFDVTGVRYDAQYGSTYIVLDANNGQEDDDTQLRLVNDLLEKGWTEVTN